ncbi:acetyl-CoA carboxylase biotin carboxyl carrier protein subunit [Erwiniaceae bacterium BAC15a-03b]|uniref:Acetyl-CoA carboxylase biotin carboxyl carrier protein subunit n=1 Tax=Winslowiella arboricola TaxID=2978220 RepID=A0A9J6PQ85_9GAMM|nr:biotin/lipoyl-containing protein [Winslowiella arboricola]MCU5772133.1 acetyl-CoA carboxylase biotin carboxyl carrier protein subunit [Winslowiella arboricola]MCU5778531.1 acetyl-CoA carboxylase biotin carboxyl carrier protein subunit [Winslowiella arboricola]
MQNKSLALRDLRKIAQKMRASGLGCIEFGGDNYRVRLEYAPQAAQLMPITAGASAPESPVLADSAALCAPMPGTVLLQHPANGLPFTSPGAEVQKDAMLALLKVGLIYLPLRSPVTGVVESLQVAQGECVEYGSEIMLLRNAELAA